MTRSEKQRRHRGDGSIRQRSPGSYEVRYPLAIDALTGKRRTANVTIKGTLSDAKKELRRRLHSQDQGMHVDPSRTTVSDFLEKWLSDWAALHVSGKTSERYGELIRCHVIPHLGRLPLQKLRAAHLSELYGKLQRESGLAPRTTGHVHRVLHHALGHALQRSDIATNPADAVKPPKFVPKEVQILREGDAQRLLTGLKCHRLYPITVTALGTGARSGELLALRWCDVELDRGMMHIEQALEQTKAGRRTKEPKSKHSRRAISLPSFVVAELRAHWKAQQEQRLALGMGKSPPESLVFPRWDGQPQRKDNFSEAWTKAARSLGLKVTFHALRHTHASQLIASGMDILTISRRLGHSSPTITLTVYGHKFANTDDRAAQVLDAAYVGSVSV